MRTFGWILVTVVLGALAGCRLDADCFGSNECNQGLVCYRGRCTEPFAIGDAGPDAGIRSYTWVDDVEPIIQRRCVSCHTTPTVNGAPFALLSYQDTQGPAPAGGLIYERMAARMVAGTMPPGGGATEAEIGVVRDWAALGAPEGRMDVDGGVRDTGPRPDVGFPDVGPRNPIPPGAMVNVVSILATVTESPVWRPATNDLLFVDVVGNSIRRLVPPGTTSTNLIAPSNEAAAIRILPNGDLLAAQFVTRRIARFPAGGGEEAVVETWRGTRFNSPNDLDVRSDGTIYFSDWAPGNRPRDLAFNGFFRVTTTSSVVLEWQDAPAPNGVELSEDESLLYLSDTQDGVVWVFDVAADGSLSNRRMFAENIDGADGMTHDDEGNLYVAGSAGITVLAPDGTLWGTIPTANATNSGFGGADRRTLYITTDFNNLRAVLLTIPGPP